MNLTNNEKSARIAEYFGWIRVRPDTVPDRVWPCKSCVTGNDNWWMMFPPVNLPLTTGKVAESVPEYFTDLNHTHAAVRTLDDKQFHTFTLKLCDISWVKFPRQTHESHADYINRLRVSFAGSADEQAEALGLTLNLWEKGQ